MKILIIAFFGLIATVASSQTNIISLKDHSGDISTIQIETDNFGLPNWKMGIDTVIFVKTGCIVEVNHYGNRDTLFAEHYGQILTYDFENEYSDLCVFIGFKKPQTIKNDTNHFFDDMKRNAFPVAFVIILGFLGFHSLSRND